MVVLRPWLFHIALYGCKIHPSYEGAGFFYNCSFFFISNSQNYFYLFTGLKQ
jgi:hypothetical protein